MLSLTLLIGAGAVCVCRREDAMRALEASHEKRFFGSKVTVSIHDGVGKIIISLTDDTDEVQRQQLK